MPKSNQDRIYIHDDDYRCHPWDQPGIHDHSTPTLPRNLKKTVSQNSTPQHEHLEKKQANSQRNRVSVHKKTNTKLAELQSLKSENTKQIRPIDTAALKLSKSIPVTITCLNELMKAEKGERQDDNLRFRTPENKDKEVEHTRIQ